MQTGGFLNLKLRTKLILSFTLVLVLTVFLGLFSLMKLAAVRATTVDMAENWLPSVQVLGEMRNDMAAMRRFQLRIALAKNDDERVRCKHDLDSAQAAFKKSQTLYDPMISGADERKLSDAIAASFEVYSKSNDEVEQLSRQGKTANALEYIMGPQKASYDTLSSAIAADITFNSDGADKANSLSKVIYASARIWVIGVLVSAVILGLLIALFIARLISRPVREVGEVAKQIAAGDLTGDEIKVRSSDEVGELAASVNSMQSSLRKVIQAISENAQNVANASEEFSSVSQQISANSEETSAQANSVSTATEEVNRNLHTVATATEEMSASISEIAKNATEAAKVAAEAMRTANETNAIVGKLGASSAEIGQVIKAITSIAQKTDLLALNATVEAARAGEVGAGFAVVANEVKELAKQTATATEDISRKIEAIQLDTKAAVQAITSITGVITRVNEISGTIAAAVEEQSATTNEMSRNLTEAARGATQVTENIGGVAQAAQNTSHGATDSLKAAQQLAQLSHKLRQLVEQFKLERAPGDSLRRSYNAPSNRQGTTAEAEQREEVLTR